MVRFTACLIQRSADETIVRSLYIRAWFLGMVVAALSVVNSTLAAGLVDQPYTVYVCEDGSYARCGPSQEHYRTDRLLEGDALEVYLETEDGWLGIRPPESSFCWLPSDQAEVQEGKSVGTITDPDAVAWIGTNLGSARKYRWQVQFQRGETITVLGQTQRINADGKPEIWYRIVPPAGEFRWVHDSQVVSTREQIASRRRELETEQVARMKHAPDKSADAQEIAVDEHSHRHDSPDHLASANANESQNEYEHERHGDDRPSPERTEDRYADQETIQAGFDQQFDQLSPQRRFSGHDDVPVRTVTTTSSHRDESPAPRRHPDAVTSWTRSARTDAPHHRPTNEALSDFHTTTHSQSQVTDPLQALQIDMARLMARRGSAAEAATILSEARYLNDSLTDPKDRDRAQSLIDRIEKYQQLAKQRDWGQGESGQGDALDEAHSTSHRATRISGERSMSRSSIVSTERELERGSVVTADREADRYMAHDDEASGQASERQTEPSGTASRSAGRSTGEGILVKVYSARRDAPPFALTDDDGKTIYYVVPLARQNISRMLNRRVHAVGPLDGQTEDGVPLIDRARITQVESRYSR